MSLDFRPGVAFEHLAEAIGIVGFDGSNERRDGAGHRFDLRVHWAHSPTDRNGEFFTEAVLIVKAPILNAVFMDEHGELDVVTAILGDFEQLSFAKPMDRLHALGSLLDAKGGDGDGIEREPVLQLILQRQHEVEGRQLAQV